jgi:protein-disulfide isomerase
MPSGKQSKRRRRAAQAPLPPTRTRRQASPRVLIAAAAAVVLIVVGIVLGVLFVGGGGSSSGATAAKLPDATDVQQFLAGIPQHGNVLGKPSAPVTMIEYVDLQCPFCQQFETSAMPTLIARYVRKGKLKVEARVVAFLGLDSARGRSAALAAGRQNKQFNFIQLLYDNQGAENTGWLDDDMVKSAAASIPGLDAGRLLSERNSSAIDDEAKALDVQQAQDKVKATPTIFVGKSGAKPKLVRLSSPTDEASVAAAIDAAL